MKIEELSDFRYLNSTLVPKNQAKDLDNVAINALNPFGTIAKAS